MRENVRVGKVLAKQSLKTTDDLVAASGRAGLKTYKKGSSLVFVGRIAEFGQGLKETEVKKGRFMEGNLPFGSLWVLTTRALIFRYGKNA